jgi:hypothetical protein
MHCHIFRFFGAMLLYISYVNSKHVTILKDSSKGYNYLKVLLMVARRMYQIGFT